MKVPGMAKEELDEANRTNEEKKVQIPSDRKAHFEKSDIPSNILSDLFFQHAANYLCPECRTARNVQAIDIFGSETLLDLFCLINGRDCRVCGTSSLLKDQAAARDKLAAIIAENAFNNVYYLLGATQNFGRVRLKPQQLNEIDLAEIGVLPESKVLDIHYTPSGRCFPLEFHGNNPRYRQKYESAKIFLWPAEIFKNVESNESTVSVNVISLPRTEDGIQFGILNAIDAFIDDDQNELIMNANIAVELATNKVCFKELVKQKKEDEVEEFLKTASYNYQLKFILGLVSKANGATQIESSILSGLDTIRRRRNDIAHRGRLQTRNGDVLELTKKEKSETLATMIISVGILKHIERGI